MANIDDYLPGGKLDPAGGTISDEITEAETKQQTRQDDATSVNWEDRYKELEKHNSRQAQTLGQQRKMIDDYILDPTPATPVVEEELKDITLDDLYDNPAEALSRAVEAHPAIQEARQNNEDAQKRELQSSLDNFKTRHPDFEEIGADPKFRNWVDDDNMRQELYARGDKFDLSAADALFSLYKAESGMKQVTQEQEQAQAIAAVTLEDSSAIMVSDQPKYSRFEYVQTLTKAKQGNLDADAWIKANAAGYREALATGNVRD